MSVHNSNNSVLKFHVMESKVTPKTIDGNHCQARLNSHNTHFLALHPLPKE